VREVEFRLDGDALLHAGERRALTEADWARFAVWIRQYHDISWLPHIQDRLLDLGRQIHDWLDGPERWVEKLREIPDAPVIAEFAVRARPDEKARRFLEVPWELAADGAGFLAEQANVRWAPVRRVGLRADPLPPDDDLRLGVMFMAASPFGERVLDYDTEELAILRATERVGLDLVVEDSGNLDELRVAWEDAKLDALHLSCHGLGGREPFLALEDDSGERDEVGLDRLANAFTARPPRLLFLSTCHTSLDSLAFGLVGLGIPAVLAWADAVYDDDASAFAGAFYREAAKRATSIAAAWALARFSLLRPGRRLPPPGCHLARLFLGPRGGGPLAVGRAARLASYDAGRKDIVEARGGRIEVANRFEFVGRRREIQIIRREFRRPKHAGVLISGFAGTGKSSLAAHIIDRHPELTPVVLFQRCDGPSVLSAIRERVGWTAAEICDRWRDRADPTGPNYDPDALLDALCALFEGPCRYAGSGKPILLLLDDFETLLDPPLGDGHWQVTHDAVAPLAAIIGAFDRGGTASRLLITSRYEFRLNDAHRDPASRLLSVPLPETSLANRLKQARQKVALHRGGSEMLPPLTQRAIEAARGNAGLQDLLFQAVLTDRAIGQAAIEALENYLVRGDLPAQAEMRETLEKLAVDRLIDLLTRDERNLLRIATLFELPLPLSIWKKFAQRVGQGGLDRLLALGLWERLPDVVNPRADAASPNGIATARLTPFPDKEAREVVTAVLPDLFAAWGGPDRSQTPFAADFELTRLALLCGNLDVLAATAVFTIRGLEQAFEYRAAAGIAAKTLDALEAGGRVPEIRLVRAAAEVFDYVGDAEGLTRIYANAGEMADNPSQPAEVRLARAQFRAHYGSYLRRQGEPDVALHELRAASAVFEALNERRERAITLGDIARILTDKGEVDEALGLHEEQLQIFQALGDHRSRTVTLGDIARIMAAKGEVDEALALHQERLQTYEALGDRRERAVTLGDIARIKTAKGEVDEALALHHEQLQIVQALGDRRARAVTLGDIARIKTDKGEVDEALALHEEELQTYEAPGDRRSRAVTLGDIARIKTAKGEVDEALALHQEQLQIFQALGDRRSRAVTLGDIARIKTAKGEVDEALALHQEQLQTYEALGDRRSRAVTLGDIARIKTAKGEVDEALALHEERLKTCEALGDRRSRAVTLGDIARIKTAKGEVNEALALHEERLQTHEALGDRDGIANAGYDIGQVQLFRALEKGDGDVLRTAVEALVRSYTINLEIGRLDGICYVGSVLGRVLAMVGQEDEAREVLQRSIDGFRKLGATSPLREVEGLLAELNRREEHPPAARS
jgi:tetratricopeptide (TPR) repeat protein